MYSLSKGGYAFITEKSWYQAVAAEEEDKNCQLALMGEEFYPTSYGYAFQTESLTVARQKRVQACSCTLKPLTDEHWIRIGDREKSVRCLKLCAKLLDFGSERFASELARLCQK